MSIYENLKKYSASETVPMHMPGHKRNTLLLPDYAIDITEIPGFDNLHHAEGIIKESMDRAASIYGTLSTHYVINGSTAAIQAAIHASVKAGSRLLMARNCHRSVYNECIIRNIEPVYIYPENGIITPDSVKYAINNNPDVSALIITSPTYDGYVSDIGAIYDLCKSAGITFIVDEAHGAHLPFAARAFEQGFMKENIFPHSAIGHADIVIQSVHKTLPAMTQTALLHRCTDKISYSEINKTLSYYQSSSPSYVLMASIEQAIEYTVSNPELFEKFSENLKRVYEFADSQAKGLLCPGGFGRDLSKIVIDVRNLPMTGGQIYDILKDRFGIVSEMYTDDTCILICTICDSADAFDRIEDALRYLAPYVNGNIASPVSINEYPERRRKYHLSYAVTLDSAPVDIKKAGELISSGRELVLKEMITAYPPGFPLAVPGEILDIDLIERLKAAASVGREIYGFENNKLEVIYG